MVLIFISQKIKYNRQYILSYCYQKKTSSRQIQMVGTIIYTSGIKSPFLVMPTGDLFNHIDHLIKINGKLFQIERAFSETTFLLNEISDCDSDCIIHIPQVGTIRY